MSAPREVVARHDSLPDPFAALRGLSGKLRAVLVRSHGDSALRTETYLAGDSTMFHALPLMPLSAKAGSSWRGYRVGYWPGEQARARAARYALPAGFIAVTPDNADLAVSQRFRLRHFLTHDQQDAWPKVLVLQLPLIDKLELIADRLAQLGRSDAVKVMSGFRTPQYNAQGVGRGGRARDSRHMYGDAADIYVDADGDGRMDDLDRDGRVTINDARWLAQVAEEVGALYPELVGGIGVYKANAVHGPFVHVDLRGTLVRW
ncbi:MAG TPA: D-Ala-D-Ala carboxypeptidase family metallohydrolase [Gemmatimonadales bacterium]|nr:D-Ala-D-Ala carboxypeptidase family metallohydrolase [Gemmatimonadales bacterium]